MTFSLQRPGVVLARRDTCISRCRPAGAVRATAAMAARSVLRRPRGRFVRAADHRPDHARPQCRRGQAGGVATRTPCPDMQNGGADARPAGNARRSRLLRPASPRFESSRSPCGPPDGHRRSRGILQRAGAPRPPPHRLDSAPSAETPWWSVTPRRSSLRQGRTPSDHPPTRAVHQILLVCSWNQPKPISRAAGSISTSRVSRVCIQPLRVAISFS